MGDAFVKGEGVLFGAIVDTVDSGGIDERIGDGVVVGEEVVVVGDLIGGDADDFGVCEDAMWGDCSPFDFLCSSAKCK